MLGLTRAKSAGAKGETAIRVVDSGGVVKEEGAFGLVEAALLAAEDEGAEFEAGVDIGEVRLLFVVKSAVLEVEEAADAAAGGYGFEEAGGGLIGVDAGRGEQADDAVRFDQTHGTFDEEGVEVDVAAAQQRIVAGTADEAGRGGRRAAWRRRIRTVASGSPWSRSCSLMPRRRAAAVGARASFRRAGGEPFDLLQLDRSQGGLPMTSVEAADWLVILPAVPDARESGFPVQNALAVGDLFGGAPQISVKAGQKVRCRIGSAASYAVGAIRQE